MVKKHITSTRKSSKLQSKFEVPPPIKPLGQGHRSDPPLRLSFTLPVEYPVCLKFRAECALSVVNGRGYTHRELAWACRGLVDELNLYAYAAVRLGQIDPDGAVSAIRAVVHQAIHENREDDREREEAKRQLNNSSAWSHLLQSISGALEERAREYQKIVAQPTASPVKIEPFIHTPDYRSIIYMEVPYLLGANAATIIRLLHEAHRGGKNRFVSKDVLLAAIGAEDSRVDSYFRGPLKGLWKTLIKGNSTGNYYLDLPPITPRVN